MQSINKWLGKKPWKHPWIYDMAATFEALFMLSACQYQKHGESELLNWSADRMKNKAHCLICEPEHINRIRKMIFNQVSFWKEGFKWICVSMTFSKHFNFLHKIKKGIRIQMTETCLSISNIKGSFIHSILAELQSTGPIQWKPIHFECPKLWGSVR